VNILKKSSWLYKRRVYIVEVWINFSTNHGDWRFKGRKQYWDISEKWNCLPKFSTTVGARWWIFRIAPISSVLSGWSDSFELASNSLFFNFTHSGQRGGCVVLLTCLIVVWTRQFPPNDILFVHPHQRIDRVFMADPVWKGGPVFLSFKGLPKGFLFSFMIAACQGFVIEWKMIWIRWSFFAGYFLFLLAMRRCGMQSANNRQKPFPKSRKCCVDVANQRLNAAKMLQ
jgi:hypothetical protein